MTPHHRAWLRGHRLAEALPFRQCLGCSAFHDFQVQSCPCGRAWHGEHRAWRICDETDIDAELSHLSVPHFVGVGNSDDKGEG